MAAKKAGLIKKRKINEVSYFHKTNNNQDGYCSVEQDTSTDFLIQVQYEARGYPEFCDHKWIAMIRNIEAADYPELIKIWESAVWNTHDFLQEEDLNYYKERLPLYFEQVLLLGFEEAGRLVGFMGASGTHLEMLFIHNDFHGRGIGKKLALYGIDQLKITRVDVNEQNTQAVDFYKHMGFHLLKRSALDGQGKAYPVLHMGL